MAHAVQIVIDCADPSALSEFWAAALGYVIQPPPEGYATPGRNCSEESLRRSRLAAKVNELTAIGATMFREVEANGEHWVVLRDPEGNEFCVT